MRSKAMEELNIKLWEAELTRCRAEEERLKKIMDDDPTQMLIDCNLAFAKLLDDYQGKERLTPQFKAELAKLSRKEKRAKKLQEGYDFMKAMDDYHKAKLHADNVQTELANFKFRYKIYHKTEEKERKGRIVKNIAERAVKNAEKATK